MPMEYNTASTVFFWMVYIPLMLGLPLAFAGYVVVDIMYRGLLPPTGRRRQLSMFLLRLCCLYFAIWFPFLILFLIGNFVRIRPLIHWMGALLSHLQGLVSALFCLTNQAINHAFYLTLTCQPIAREEEIIHGGSSTTGSSEFIRSSFFLSLQNRWGSKKSSTRSQEPVMDLVDDSGVIPAIGIPDSGRSVDHDDRLLQEELAQPPNKFDGEEGDTISDKNNKEEEEIEQEK